ncbi:hypothetical protein Taro_052345 [Colocasia esculenta]|uniref:Uncharacterized protein n=1 Tax=Colocasia esculenta TaxID=4460 RepID=A0A843XJG0_COLES|nr:hypothetical protein [Colocasia esculenta]
MTINFDWHAQNIARAEITLHWLVTTTKRRRKGITFPRSKVKPFFFPSLQNPLSSPTKIFPPFSPSCFLRPHKSSLARNFFHERRPFFSSYLPSSSTPDRGTSGKKKPFSSIKEAVFVGTGEKLRAEEAKMARSDAGLNAGICIAVDGAERYRVQRRYLLPPATRPPNLPGEVRKPSLPVSHHSSFWLLVQMIVRVLELAGTVMDELAGPSSPRKDAIAGHCHEFMKSIRVLLPASFPSLTPPLLFCFLGFLRTFGIYIHTRAMSKQPLVYNFVAKGTIVLAKHTSFYGNFSRIAVQCL